MNWQRLRESILTNQPLCEVCLKQGITTGAQQVDHIVPLSLGGTNDPINLQSICSQCHWNKTGRENTYKVSVGIDGYPKQDMRQQILVRRHKHRHAMKSYYRKKFRQARERNAQRNAPLGA